MRPSPSPSSAPGVKRTYSLSKVGVPELLLGAGTLGEGPGRGGAFCWSPYGVEEGECGEGNGMVEERGGGLAVVGLIASNSVDGRRGGAGEESTFGVEEGSRDRGGSGGWYELAPFEEVGFEEPQRDEEGTGPGLKASDGAPFGVQSKTGPCDGPALPPPPPPALAPLRPLAEPFE